MLDYLPHLDADGQQGASAVENVASVTVDQARLADARLTQEQELDG